MVIGQGTIQELAGGNPEDRRIWMKKRREFRVSRLDKRSGKQTIKSAARDMTRILGDLLLELRDRQASLYTDWQTAKGTKICSKRRTILSWPCGCIWRANKITTGASEFDVVVVVVKC